MASYSLLELLNYDGWENIEIPAIQRDYAFGRQEATQKRKQFIKDILNSLLNKDKKLDLDFIYGKINDKKNLIILDGQQRITTLWLVYFYLNLSKQECAYPKISIKEILSKFSYTIAEAPKKFCKELINSSSEDFFKNFCKSPDPTIKGMIVVLNEINEQYKKINKEENENWYPKNITFSFLDMGNYNLSDELYLKMNDRGKQLTLFENFKASFGESNKDFSEQYEKKWHDFFWSNLRNENNTIDNEIYNVIGTLFAYYGAINYDEGKVSNKLSDYNRILERMLKNPAASEDITYYWYKTNTIVNQNSFFINDKSSEFIICALDYISDINISDINISGNNVFMKNDSCETETFNNRSGYNVISNGSSNGFLSNIAKGCAKYADRIRFYIYLKLLKQFKGFKNLPNQEIKHVFRVFDNLIDNSTLGRDNFINMIKTIDYILDESKGDIYNFLSKIEISKKNNTYCFNYNKEDKVFNNIGYYIPQMAEEILKIKLIQSDELWEAKILNAEANKYFNGNIKFLLACSNKNKPEMFLTYNNTNYDKDLFDSYANILLTNYVKNHIGIFNDDGLSVEHHLWVAALLNKSGQEHGEDYIPEEKIPNFTFGYDKEWKTCILNDTNTETEYKSKYIKILLDDIRGKENINEVKDLNEKLKNSFSTIVRREKEEVKWIENVVQYNEILRDKLTNVKRFARKGNDICLLTSTRKNNDRSLYLYIMYNLLNEEIKNNKVNIEIKNCEGERANIQHKISIKVKDKTMYLLLQYRGGWGDRLKWEIQLDAECGKYPASININKSDEWFIDSNKGFGEYDKVCGDKFICCPGSKLYITYLNPIVSSKFGYNYESVVKYIVGLCKVLDEDKKYTFDNLLKDMEIKK